MKHARGSDTAAARYLLLALHGDQREPSDDEMVGGMLLARGLRHLERIAAFTGALAGVKPPKE